MTQLVNHLKGAVQCLDDFDLENDALYALYDAGWPGLDDDPAYSLRDLLAKATSADAFFQRANERFSTDDALVLIRLAFSVLRRITGVRKKYTADKETHTEVGVLIELVRAAFDFHGFQLDAKYMVDRARFHSRSESRHTAHGEKP